MNGRLGLAAWRWLFILDFLISVPVVILGLIVCPGKTEEYTILSAPDLIRHWTDEPKSKKVWWMTEQERQRCIERMTDEGRDAQHFHWDRALIKQVFMSWQLYAFCLAWASVTLFRDLIGQC
jgi:ACS family pantothenate transporter-like MFS transporter